MPCEDGRCQNLPGEVWRQIPLKQEDGSPLFRDVTETLEEGPANPVLHFLGYALAGGAAGAAGDHVRLEWQEKPIAEKELGGYYHEVSSRYTTRCRPDWKGRMRCRQEHDGYDHEFRADINKRQVGSHQAPVVVHYRE